jgi:hypothetical protein
MNFLFVVGDSVILDPKLVGEKEGRMELIFEAMMALLARKAVKQFHSSKKPESELAGLFEKMDIGAAETD